MSEFDVGLGKGLIVDVVVLIIVLVGSVGCWRVVKGLCILSVDIVDDVGVEIDILVIVVIVSCFFNVEILLMEV